MNEFDTARREWDNEVDHEAAELVRRGVPPFEAVEQARENASRRRRLSRIRNPIDIEHLIDKTVGARR